MKADNEEHRVSNTVITTTTDSKGDGKRHRVLLLAKKLLQIPRSNDNSDLFEDVSQEYLQLIQEQDDDDDDYCGEQILQLAIDAICQERAENSSIGLDNTRGIRVLSLHPGGVLPFLGKAVLANKEDLNQLRVCCEIAENSYYCDFLDFKYLAETGEALTLLFEQYYWEDPKFSFLFLKCVKNQRILFPTPTSRAVVSYMFGSSCLKILGRARTTHVEHEELAFAFLRHGVREGEVAFGDQLENESCTEDMTAGICLYLNKIRQSQYPLQGPILLAIEQYLSNVCLVENALGMLDISCKDHLGESRLLKNYERNGILC